MKDGREENISRNYSQEHSEKNTEEYSTEEKIRNVIEGLRGENTVAELCRREGINQNLYYKWSKEFLDAGKQRLAGNTKRQASSNEVKEPRREREQLKQLVAELALKNRVLKKACLARTQRGMTDASFTSGEDGNHPSGGAFRPTHHKDIGRIGCSTQYLLPLVFRSTKKWIMRDWQMTGPAHASSGTESQTPSGIRSYRWPWHILKNLPGNWRGTSRIQKDSSSLNRACTTF